MIFFFKEKPLVVDAFCSETMSFANTNAPIDYAYKFYPDWWKELEPGEFDWKTMKANTNMRNCVGFTNEYKNGLILPMWSDLAISWVKDGKYRYQFSDMLSKATSHINLQRGSFKKDHFQFKILSPWLLSTEKEILFQWKEPYYNLNEEIDYDILPGTIDYKYQKSTHINLLLKPGINQNVKIDFGTPMVHIRPLSEKKLILKRHIVTDAEFAKRENVLSRIKFFKSYGLLKKGIDKQSKCPFGFGK